MDRLKIFKNIAVKLNYIFNKRQKIGFFFTLISLIMGSIVELLSVSCILPLLQAMISPEELTKNRYVIIICNFFNIDVMSNLFGWVCLFIVLIYFVKNVYLYFATFVSNKFSYECQRDLSTSMLSAYTSQPYVYFLENNSASMLRGINEDVAGTYVIVKNLFLIVSNVLTTILLVMYLLTTDIYMTFGILFLSVLCVLCLGLGFKTKLREYGKKRSEANNRCNQTSIQTLSGIKEIMVFRRSKYFVNEFEKAADDRKKAYLHQSLISTLPSKLVETVCISGFIGLVYLNYSMDTDMAQLIPKLGIFAVGALKMMPLVSSLSTIMADIIFYSPSLECIYENFKAAEAKIKERDDNIRDDYSVQILHQIKNGDFKVVVKDVCWKYPTSQEYILNNLNVTIDKGEAIALIGMSGAGKSTLADVLLGLLPPQRGCVLINNRDISEIPFLWSKLVAYVPQNIYLIDDTIRSNIAFGIEKDKIDDNQIWETLEKARLREFVEGLPMGLDTIVGERGVKFSGGQRQRVAIARALYSGPEILVLDEATSALDNETELAVMESINALHGEITLIVIAHRLSTIKGCDRVYEIKDGMIEFHDKEEILTNDIGYNNKLD